MKLTHLYADITKSEKDAETGDLMVTGVAASPTLDIDKQIADPAWLKSAMPAWMEFGNVREQHSKVAAGVGMELDEDGENWNLKAAIIDPVSAMKVEKKVLKGFSIGIKAPRIVKDAAAPGGRIVGGEIVEISLVDRPANADCRIDIAKSASKGDWEPVDAPDDEEIEDVEKGAEVDYDKVQSVIDAFAVIKATVAQSLTKAADDEWTHDPAAVNAAFQGILALLQAEIDEWAKGEDERWDVQQLFDAASLVASWAQDEAREGEIPQPFTQGDDSMTMLSFGVDPDVVKAATAEDATDEARDALKCEVQKALGVDADSLGEKIAAVLPDAVKGLFEERSNALEERLARIEGSAAPGGPVTTRTNAESAKASEADHLRAEAIKYRQTADNVDHETAKHYRQKAAELDAAASKLAAP